MTRHRGSASETIADMAAYAVEDMRQGRAAKASALIGALQALARQTRFIDGAKYLLLFSQGFESDLYTQEGQSWLYSDIQEAVEELPAGGMEHPRHRDGRRMVRPAPEAEAGDPGPLADQTGGELYSKSADLIEAVGEVLGARASPTCSASRPARSRWTARSARSGWSSPTTPAVRASSIAPATSHHAGAAPGTTRPGVRTPASSS